MGKAHSLYQSPMEWASAVAAAGLFAAVAAGVVVALFALFGWSGWWPAATVGGVVGGGVGAVMLWLFRWRQVTAQEIWQGIAALWQEFGNY